MESLSLPQLRAIRYGTVLVLDDSGDLAADLYAAIGAASGRDRVPLSRDELETLLGEEQEARGLRAEAGYSGVFVVILWAGDREQLRDGVDMLSWLVLSETHAGDAVYWQTAVGPPGSMELLPLCAFRPEHDKLVETLRFIAGTNKITDGK